MNAYTFSFSAELYPCYLKHSDLILNFTHVVATIGLYVTKEFNGDMKALKLRNFGLQYIAWTYVTSRLLFQCVVSILLSGEWWVCVMCSILLLYKGVAFGCCMWELTLNVGLGASFDSMQDSKGMRARGGEVNTVRLVSSANEWYPLNCQWVRLSPDLMNNISLVEPAKFPAEFWVC
jgi:hypothetical protein